MDFLSKLPNGHSLKTDRPTAAHSLGLGGPVTPQQAGRRPNYHYQS